MGTTLDKVRLKDYVDREAKILELCRGRRVLHLGCVGFTDYPAKERVRLAQKSLHYLLSQHCDCVGIDLDRSSIEGLKQNGIFMNVLFGDVERLEESAPDLGPFDLVVAGDIIEHVSNPGKMLDGVRKLLKPGGLLIVSTPNAMGLHAYLCFLAGRFLEGLQHVLSFNAITLFQLLERHGYQVIEAYSCHQASARQNYGLLYVVARKVFQVFTKFGGTLLYVSVPR